MMASWIESAHAFHKVATPPTAENGWCTMAAWQCECYYDIAQTTNIQTVTIRSIPIPVGQIYDFDVVAVIMNDAQDKGGRIQGIGTVGRGSGNVFRPTAMDLKNIKNLGNSSLDLIANTVTQSADVQVQGTTSGAGIINWHVWTNVRRSA